SRVRSAWNGMPLRIESPKLKDVRSWLRAGLFSELEHAQLSFDCSVMDHRGLRIVEGSTARAACQAGIEIVCQLIKRKPNAVIGFASGGNLQVFYQELIKLRRINKISFSGVKAIALETMPAKEADGEGQASWLTFFNDLGISSGNVHFLKAFNSASIG